MSAVNVIIGDHSKSHIPKLNGEIKRLAHDFEVRELHSQENDQPKVPTSKSTNLDSGKAEVFSECIEEDVELEKTFSSGVDYLNHVISCDVYLQISRISTDYQLSLISVQEGDGGSSCVESRLAVQLPSKMSKKQRGFFHITLRATFPCLRTVAMSADECSQHFSRITHSEHANSNESGNGEDSMGTNNDEPMEELIDDQNGEMGVLDMVDDEIITVNLSSSGCRNDSVETLSGIWVSADKCFAELAKTTLSAVDILSLYVFKANGPLHANASAGVRIGLGLSRDDRTKVYRIVTSKCLSLDSKTIEDRNNKKKKKFSHEKNCVSADALPKEECSKSMLVFWRKKAMNSRDKKDKKDENDENDEQTEAQVLYIGFHLIKLQTEHLQAISSIASAIGVAVNDISFCGIKDKKAITYQKCVLTLRSLPNSNSRYNEISTECSLGAQECLKNVPESSFRNYAAMIIDILMNNFPSELQLQVRFRMQQIMLLILREQSNMVPV